MPSMDAAAVLAWITSRHEGLDLLSTPGCEFVYYDPARDTPHDRRQPFVTILTTDEYDHASDLQPRGLFRVNLGVERETYRSMFGPEPKWGPDGTYQTGRDLTLVDVFHPHPHYAPLGWVCIVAPSAASWPRVSALLDEAYEKAKRSYRPPAVGAA